MPLESPSSWISRQDVSRIPPNSLKSSFSKFSVNVLKSGAVSDCQIETSSGSSELDSLICLSLELRGKYKLANGYDADKNNNRVSVVFYARREGSFLKIWDFTYSKKENLGDISDKAWALPLNDPGLWVRSSDYPKEAKKIRAVGTVNFVVKVSQDGLPIACVIVKSSGNILLDNATCSLVMKRAKFNPPKNIQGNYEEGYFPSGVNWVL